MKLIHLSDLHLGITVHEFSMLEDQEYILRQILNVIDSESPGAVLISGDIFDRSVAPTDALRIFENFLDAVSSRRIPLFVISGNHDSADRLSFASRLLDRSEVHICRAYEGAAVTRTLRDEYGPVHIHMLPFLKPAAVRRYFPDEKIESWTDAMRAALSGKIDTRERNVLLAHQFVTGASRSDSEDHSVGGADNVDAEVFSAFDYTALGHLHRAQTVGGRPVRYCGSPLKYSFSEAGQNKTVTVVELGRKGSVDIREVPLVPNRDMREIRGKFQEVIARQFYAGQDTEDYVRITLTDEEDEPDALSRLRVIYHNLMRLDYDNKRTRQDSKITGIGDADQYTPLQLFESFYMEENGQPLSDAQRDYLTGVIEDVWRDEK